MILEKGVVDGKITVLGNYEKEDDWEDKNVIFLFILYNLLQEYSSFQCQPVCHKCCQFKFFEEKLHYSVKEDIIDSVLFTHHIFELDFL